MVGPLGLIVAGLLVVAFTPVDLIGWFLVILGVLAAVFPGARPRF